ncbi:MAG: hypothetical protein AVDCRST_MAG49-1233 [uncultured Thermomicrobiales bacterium]|uniref:Uncharacterized protein n=1 Tax=uncultured Thermomicrobiales bacterium TaxID=1645740 RepID=A0A6J4UBH6_9BACT|nr:MAG: hypothetical protein AVDCRST_MAG49-1233 [uncultured Thermomicrobiales bacterium]
MVVAHGVPTLAALPGVASPRRGRRAWRRTRPTIISTYHRVDAARVPVRLRGSAA